MPSPQSYIFMVKLMYAVTQTSPVQITTLSALKIVKIAAGGGHTCCIDETGSTAYCWGSNATGQLGTGTTSKDSYITFSLSSTILSNTIYINPPDKNIPLSTNQITSLMMLNIIMSNSTIVILIHIFS